MKAVLYSKTNCPACVKAKNLLKEHNVEYEEHNIEENEEKASEMIKKSGQRGVPVVDLAGNVIVGFSPIRMKKFL